MKDTSYEPTASVSDNMKTYLLDRTAAAGFVSDLIKYSEPVLQLTMIIGPGKSEVCCALTVISGSSGDTETPKSSDEQQNTSKDTPGGLSPSERNEGSENDAEPKNMREVA